MSIGLRGDETDEELYEIIDLAERTKKTFGEEDEYGPPGKKLNVVHTGLLIGEDKPKLTKEEKTVEKSHKARRKIFTLRGKLAMKILKKRQRDVNQDKK